MNFWDTVAGCNLAAVLENELPKVSEALSNRQRYGTLTINLPDDIDPNNEDEVIGYISSVWSELPLPSGDYVKGSDELDPGCIEITINK